MDLRHEIMREHSKENIRAIANWIGRDHDRFAELMQLFLGEEYRLVQRSAWVLSEVGGRYPKLLLPYLARMVHALDQPLHPAVQRNVLKVFADTGLLVPEEVEGELVAQCFALLEAPKTPVAIKVHAMQLLANACERYPDLAIELGEAIRAQMPEGSAGFRSRGRKILDRLSLR